MEFWFRFEVCETLGRGTFGEVKRCVSKKTKESYAVKEIFYKTDEEEEEIQEEISLWLNLRHDNIVRLLSSYKTTNESYLLVMELVSGGELFDDITNREKYTEKLVCHFISHLLRAVEYLHQRKIMHRNIKPENILVGWKAQDNHKLPPLKLTDFSQAKKLPETADRIMCSSRGSPLYLPPETIRREKVGCPVDMWGCGTIMYILLVGYPPFWSNSRKALYSSITSGLIDFPNEDWDTVSTYAKDLIKKLMNVEPSFRPTAEEALAHAWIKDHRKLPSMHRRNTIEKLKDFNAKRKLRAAVYMLVAVKRLGNSFFTRKT